MFDGIQYQTRSVEIESIENIKLTINWTFNEIELNKFT